MKSNKLKKILATVLAFVMVVAVTQVATISVFAESKEPVYGSVTVFGDSLSLGFTDVAWSQTFDFGVCAESSADMYRVLADPAYVYYDFALDKIANSDLIALAIGSNDVYSSMLDYMANSTNLLGDFLYILTNMSQLGLTFDNLCAILQDPVMAGLLAGCISADIPVEVIAPIIDGIPEVDSEIAIATVVDGLSDLMDVQGLIEYYSRDNINAYMKPVLADYKVNYEKTLQRILELMPEDSQLVLTSAYNPYGMTNYMNPDDLAKSIADIKSELVEILKNFKNNPELSYEALIEMVEQRYLPIAAMMVNDSLVDVYSEMNSFLKDMSEKYNVIYVDISDAPTSSTFELQPTELSYNWFADQLPERVAAIVYAKWEKSATIGIACSLTLVALAAGIAVITVLRKKKDQAKEKDNI